MSSACRRRNVPAHRRNRWPFQLAELDDLPELDLTVDGTDEFDPSLRLIKGGGGALLREKIVAAASQRMVVITDASKAAETLGRFPLPVEVNRFGAEATRRLIVREAAEAGCNGPLTPADREGRAVSSPTVAITSSIAPLAPFLRRRSLPRGSSPFPALSNTVCSSAMRRR